MGFHNMFHDREPESRSAQLAASGLVHPIEPFEEAGKVFRRDAGTFVSNCDLKSPLSDAGIEPDAFPRLAVGYRVIEEINHRLFKQWGVDIGHQVRVAIQNE